MIMTDNIVDFASRLKAREKMNEELQSTQMEELHQICGEVANETLNCLRDDYDIPIENIEYSPEIIFFFESFKALVFAAVGEWHPFQGFAAEFMETYKIKVVEQENGNYSFTVDENAIKSENPANDG